MNDKLIKLTAVLISLCGVPRILSLGNRSDSLGVFFSAWSSMQFNSALGTMAIGVSILSIQQNYYKFARACSGFVSAIGGITLIQYIFKIDLGIDQLFSRGYLAVYQSYVGRMAPNTAINFFLVSIALFLLSKRNKSSKVTFISGILSTLPIAFGFVTVIGYYTKLNNSYSWGSYSLTSLPSAFIFILSGILLFILNTASFRKNKEESLYLNSLYATLGFFFITITLWQFFLDQEAKKLKKIAEINIHNARDEVVEILDQYEHALKRMAKRLEYLGTKDKTFLALDSNSYIQHLVGIVRIGLVDTKYNVTWSYPKELSSQVLGFNQGSEPKRKEVFDYALIHEKSSLSQSLELRSKGTGFLLPIPLFSKKIFLGFIYATINADLLFNKILIYEGYQLKIKENGTSIYSNKPKNFFTDSNWSHILHLNVGLNDWEIELTPTPEYIISNESNLPTTVLALGLVISVLIGLFFQQILVLRSQKIKIKEALDELSITTKKLKIIIDSSPIGILVLDKKLKLTVWNPACERIFGWSATEVLGRFLPFVPEDKVEESLGIIEKINQSKEPVYFLGNRIRKDKSIIKTETAAMPLFDDKGNVDGLIAIMTDVTDKTLLQEKLLQTNESLKVAIEKAVKEQENAIASSKVKSEFLANMSHEIRTPINGVLGMTGLLLDTKLNDEQKDFAENIKRSAESLLTIVNDILDFSKVEAGKLDLEKIEFDLNQMITDTVSTLNFSAKQKKLVLNSSGIKKWNTHFIGDPGRIRQILTNLISNAIKFTPQGNIFVRVFECYQESKEHVFRFEIQDEGVGIPPEALNRLFKAFSQADTSTTRKFGGTGLGLSICKKLTSLMNGKIDVISQEGKGSIFWFEITLPEGSLISDSEKENLAGKSKLPKELLNSLILVAEDNHINQVVTVKHLEKLGLRADVVADGNEALAALKNISYDLVLMDCQMPEMDGYEATKIIRQSNDTRFKNIPIIAMTANAVIGDKELCLKVGMNDYVRKPVSISELIKALEKWLPQKNIAATNEAKSMKKSIDTNVLDDLKKLDTDPTQNLIKELSDIFLSTVPEKLLQMKNLLALKDYKKIKAFAHSLKSSSGNMGAMIFSKLCEDLESLEDFSSNQAAELIDKIEKEFVVVQNSLNEYLNKAA